MTIEESTSPAAAAPGPQEPPKSTGAYAPDKALAWPERLEALKAGRQPYPVHVQVIPSDLCNRDCGYCAYRASGYSSSTLFGEKRADGSLNRNPNRMLDRELLFRILDDCLAMGVRAISATGGGEPTLHPNIVEFLRKAQSYRIATALITNGLLLGRTPGLLAATVAGAWARISIDAATEKTFGVVRPGLGGPRGADLRLVLRNLAALRALRDADRASCTIGASFVAQKENWREIYDAVKIYREQGADNVRISGTFSTEGSRYFDGWREEAEELERRAVADFDGKDGFRVHGRLCEKAADLDHGAPSIERCWYQEFTTYIGGDGRLYRCCVYAFHPRGLIGDLREAGGFKALWDSTHKQEDFARFRAPGCDHCQFLDRLAAIDAAVKAPTLPIAPEFIHPGFV